MQQQNLKPGDLIPFVTLYEFIDKEVPQCVIGPNKFEVQDLVKDKNIALFALPGAFTPTCSSQHVPGFIKLYEEFKNAGVDEIWCISVNDAFVMGQWAKDQQTNGKVRMFGDGSCTFTKGMGLTLDLSHKGFGVRSQRYSALVIGGKIVTLNIEEPGKFEVSKADVLLEQAKQYLQQSSDI